MNPDIPKDYIPERRQGTGLRFLAPQEGPSEDLLKAKLIVFFNRDRSIQRAYLARIEIDGSESAALCLRSQFGEDPGLAEKIGRIFATIFNEDQFMDIVFLNDNNEERLQSVCAPFFDIKTSTSN